MGKLAPKADGPYKVVAVRGKFGQRVAITPVDGVNKQKKEMLEVHASQLAPYLGEYVEP